MKNEETPLYKARPMLSRLKWVDIEPHNALTGGTLYNNTPYLILLAKGQELTYFSANNVIAENSTNGITLDYMLSSISAGTDTQRISYLWNTLTLTMNVSAIDRELTRNMKTKLAPIEGDLITKVLIVEFFDLN